MRRLGFILAFFAAAGCGGPDAPEPGRAKQKTVPPVDGEAPRPAMTGQDMSLHFYSEEQRTQGEDKPTFSLFSSSCTLDEEGVWSFEEASAIIYASDGTETHLEAGQGRFDRTKEEARLAGGVTVEMGTMTVGLKDMQWENEERVALSDNAVSIKDGETRLRADSFRFRPDEDSLVLTEVTGVLAFEENAEQ